MATISNKLEFWGKRLLPEKYFQLARTAAKGQTEDAKSMRVAIFAFAIRVASAVLVFTSQVILARFLGEFEYGIFALVWTIALLAGGLACMGLNVAALKFVTIYQEQQDLEKLRGILFGATIYALGFSIATSCIGIGYIYLSSNHIAAHYWTPFLLGLCILPMLTLSNVFDNIGRSFEQTSIAFWPTFIARPSLLLSFVIFTIVFGFSANASSALICTLLAVASALIWQWMKLRHHIAAHIPKGPRQFETKLWLSTAFPIFLVFGFFELLTQMDILLLGLFVSPDQIGPYFAAVKILALVHFVQFAIRSAVQPGFARLHTKHAMAELASFAKRVTRWGFFPILAIGICVAISAPILLRLFGPNFAVTTPIVWLLMLGLVIRSSIGPADSLLNMSGNEKSCAAAYGIALIANICLNLLFIPAFGLWGAALATTIALTCEALGLWWMVKRKLNINIFLI